MKKNEKEIFNSLFLKNRRGLSIVIGYVLLIAVSITISILVYQFLKTYVPKEALACPDDTSVFIKEYNYDCQNGILTLTLQNNGKFGIAGYFIHTSVAQNPELATLDLSKNLSKTNPNPGGIITDYSITYTNGKDNSFNPGDLPKATIFDVKKTMTNLGILTKIEIIPTRYQLQDNFWKYVSCGNAKVEEAITCTP